MLVKVWFVGQQPPNISDPKIIDGDKWNLQLEYIQYVYNMNMVWLWYQWLWFGCGLNGGGYTITS